MVKIISDNLKSSFESPEFSGPKSIAVFLLTTIFLLINLKSLVKLFYHSSYFWDLLKNFICNYLIYIIQKNPLFFQNDALYYYTKACNFRKIFQYITFKLGLTKLNRFCRSHDKIYGLKQPSSLLLNISLWIS